VEDNFTPALMRVFKTELQSIARVQPVPLEIKLRLEQMRLLELIRAQGIEPTARATAFAPLAAVG
jgi:hypothetical protein